MGRVVSFQKKKKKKKAKRTQGPGGGSPQPRNTWQLAVIRMPIWVQDQEDEPPYRPWSALAISLTHDLVGGSDSVHPDDRTPELAFEALHNLAETCGEWPEVIEIRDPDLGTTLESMPELSGVEITYRPTLAGLNGMMDRMGGALNPEERTPPSATSVPGVTVDHLRAFALAAARFFAAEPWTELGNEDVIRIDSPVPDPNFRHLMVMGNGGEEFGILFLEDPNGFSLMGDGLAEEFLQNTVLWSLSSWEPSHIDYREHDMWEDQGLSFVQEDLIPAAVQYGPKRRIRRASPKYLAFIEAVLTALAETTVEEMDAGSWQRSITTSTGPNSIAFSLVDCQRDLDEDDEFGNMPSPLFMERMMIDQQPNDTDSRRQAQELAYEAMEAHGRHRKVLARQALDLWPDCADALGVLAGSATDPVEAIELFEQAVAAGEKDLGAQFFAETVGHFWGFHETRPFMRVKLALAQNLWDEERYEEAVGHYRELLRLNPNDNQSVRTLLAPALMQLGEYDEAEELLTFYKDTHSASWHYTWALLTFLKESDGSLAKRRLTAAFKWNPHVASFLTGQRPPPTEPSAYYHPGEISEAETMIAELYEVWFASEGAIAWIIDRWMRFSK